MNSDTMLLVFTFSVAFCFLVLASVLWRVVSCLPIITGTAVRAHERERQALFHLVERLYEKVTAEKGRLTETTFHHAQERKQATQVNGQVETASVASKEVVPKKKATPMISDGQAEMESILR